MGYLVFDRCIDLMNRDHFQMKSFMDKWEVSKRCVFRDLEHLKLFYDIEFKYDMKTKTFRRIENDCVFNCY